MRKKENNSFYGFNKELFRLDEMALGDSSWYKENNLNEINKTIIEKPINYYDTCYNLKKNIFNDFSLKNKMKIISNIINDNSQIYEDNKNKKIIQKEIIFNNINSPTKNKKNNILSIPINKNCYINLNNSPKNIEQKVPKKIKNIPISLKRIKIGDKLPQSKKRTSQDKYNNKNNEPYKHKSPKRNNSFKSEKILLSNNIQDINAPHKQHSSLLSKINLSPHKSHMIPRPTNNTIREKCSNINIMLGDKKVDRSMLEQSKEIKNLFKKEKEKQIKRGKSQMLFKNILEKKTENKAEYKSNQNEKVNNLKINPTKKEKTFNNNLLKSGKYILKYLLLRKNTKNNEILNKYFHIYKSKIINNNIFNLRNKKLRNLILKKEHKNRYLLYHYLTKFYYNIFFINNNSFKNIINQFFLAKNINSSFDTNKINNDNKALDILIIINRINNENKKSERKQNIKNLIQKLFLIIRNNLKNIFIRFYYQSLLNRKSIQVKEIDNINNNEKI